LEHVPLDRKDGRLTGVNRETVATLALRVGRGCAEQEQSQIRESTQGR
jgi:hypothetical protein